MLDIELHVPEKTLPKKRVTVAIFLSIIWWMKKVRRDYFVVFWIYLTVDPSCDSRDSSPFEAAFISRGIVDSFFLFATKRGITNYVQIVRSFFVENKRSAWNLTELVAVVEQYWLFIVYIACPMFVHTRHRQVIVLNLAICIFGVGTVTSEWEIWAKGLPLRRAAFVNAHMPCVCEHQNHR